MARRPFSTSPSYLQYIRGIRDLHALIAAGRDDSPEADAIRDGMDHPWYDLSETERARLKGLSADLYSISDPPKESLPPNPQVQRKLMETFDARLAGKWDRALEVLRRWSDYIDPALLSFLRGSLWDEAGDSPTAHLFFDHASRLAPQAYQGSYLHNLWKLDAVAALDFASRVIASENDHQPDVVINAAFIFFDEIQGQSAVDSPEPFERIIAASERALARLEAAEPDDQMPGDESRAIAFYLIAGCFDRLGDTRAAIRHLNRAIAIDPDNVSILESRGILRYGVESGALDDLRRASELGARDVWPGFYLAHDSFVASRFEDCLKMCERALTFPAPDEIRALLNEWLGISRAGLGHPADQVRSAFEEALRLAPDSDRTRDNLAKFEQSLANPGGPKPDWIKPKASTVRAFGRSNFRPHWPSPPIAA